MIRAAAKNHAFAAVVTSPESYDAVLDELRDADGLLSMPTRESLAAEAFAYTARYDTAIARWFAEKSRGLPAAARARLREGHRPALRREPAPARRLLPQVGARDARAVAWSASTTASSSRSTTCSTSTRRATLVRDFDEPACVIVKHNNPCGAALGATRCEAYERAFATRSAERVRRRHRVQPAGRRARPPSALAEQFVEVLFAPGYDDGRARDPARASRTIRILEDEERRAPLVGEPDVRRSWAACSSRTATSSSPTARRWRSSPQRQPTDEEWRDLLFAWRVCKHVRSNAIVLAHGRGDGRASAPAR